MKNAVTLAAFLAASVTAHANPQSASCEPLDYFSRLRCEESQAVAAAHGRVLRYGSVLFVISDQKIHPHFDWPGTPATPELAYFYQGYTSGLHVHVVRYATADNLAGGVEMIHQKSGQRLSSVGDAPMIAPGGDLLLTVTDAARYRVGEIQLWRARPEGFQSVAKFYAQGWKPALGPHKWLDDQTLQIARSCPEGGEAKAPADCGSTRIVRQGAGWKLMP